MFKKSKNIKRYAIIPSFGPAFKKSPSFKISNTGKNIPKPASSANVDNNNNDKSNSNILSGNPYLFSLFFHNIINKY